jgi:hypothetical protein
MKNPANASHAAYCQIHTLSEDEDDNEDDLPGEMLHSGESQASAAIAARRQAKPGRLMVSPQKRRGGSPHRQVCWS